MQCIRGLRIWPAKYGPRADGLTARVVARRRQIRLQDTAARVPGQIPAADQAGPECGGAFANGLPGSTAAVRKLSKISNLRGNGAGRGYRQRQHRRRLGLTYPGARTRFVVFLIQPDEFRPKKLIAP